MKIKKQTKDYSPDMLPQTRKEVFFDVIKLHLWDFVELGLVMLLFSIPLHLAAIAEDIITGSIYAEVEHAAAELQQGAYLTVLFIQVLRALISTALVPFFTLGLSGVLRVIRQYAWGENVFFVTDFAKGVRQNWKQTTLLQLIMGLIYSLSLFAQQLSSVSTGPAAWLLQIPMAVFVLVVLPVAGYVAVAISVYNAQLSNHLLTSLRMYVKAPFSTLLGLVCSMAIYSPLLIPDMYVHIFGRVICSLLTPFVLLGWCLFCYNKQDKYINSSDYPDLVGRGTFSAAKIE